MWHDSVWRVIPVEATGESFQPRRERNITDCPTPGCRLLAILSTRINNIVASLSILLAGILLLRSESSDFSSDAQLSMKRSLFASTVHACSTMLDTADNLDRTGTLGLDDAMAVRTS